MFPIDPSMIMQFLGNGGPGAGGAGNPAAAASGRPSGFMPGQMPTPPAYNAPPQLPQQASQQAMQALMGGLGAMNRPQMPAPPFGGFPNTGGGNVPGAPVAGIMDALAALQSRGRNSFGGF